MPILLKDGRRIYFAHIPKTGGTSIYLAFAAAGWTIRNLYEWEHPTSAFSQLKRKHGIRTIQREGMMPLPWMPVQHAPAIVWQRWGPFDESFALVRHPLDRIASALAYHHRLSGTADPFETFAMSVIDRARSRLLGTWRTLGGHMIPQVRFIGRDTQVLKFESDWQSALSARYGLDESGVPHANAGAPDGTPELPYSVEAWARRVYAKDFAAFDYR